MTSLTTGIRGSQRTASSRKMKTWPSLDISVGLMPPPPPKSEPYPWAIHRDAYWNGHDWQYFTEITPKPGAAPKLGLSDRFNSHKGGKASDKTYSKGLTSYAKRAVKSAVCLLFRDYDRENLSFFTGTLPPMEGEGEKAANQRFYEVVRQFNQMVKRRLESLGQTAAYVGVVEVQIKRWQTWKQLALHYHALFPGRAPDGSWAISKGEARDMWQRAIANATGQWLNCKAATRIEQPRKNLKKELAKYMSKGNSIVEEVKAADRGDELPARWWSMSHDLRHQVKSEIVEGDGDETTAFLNAMADLEKRGDIKIRPVTITQTDEKTGTEREIVVAYSGWWTSEVAFLRFLASIGRNEVSNFLIGKGILKQSA